MKDKALIDALKKKAAQLPKISSDAFDLLPVSCQKCCSASNGGNGVF